MLAVAKKAYEGKVVNITYIGNKEFDSEIVVREMVQGNEVHLVVNRIKMQVKDE